MMTVCKKCNVAHDSRDVNNGICIWCDNKENLATNFSEKNEKNSARVIKKRIKHKHRG